MDLEAVVDDLAVLDFFKFVPSIHLDEARNRTLIALSENRPSLDFAGDWGTGVRSRQPWRGERVFHADPEDLAEGGVAVRQRRLIALLAHEDVSTRSLDDDPELWTVSHIRTIEIINAMLERAGSQERAFGAASGNEAAIYILTPALFEYIRQLPLHPSYVPVSNGELR